MSRRNWRIAAVLAPALLLLASAFSPEQDTPLALGEWAIGPLALWRLALCLLLGIALAWLAAGWLPRPAARAPKAAVLTAGALLAAWVAVSLLPEPVAIEREVTMGTATGGVEAIQAREAWRLNAPWEISGPTGDPLPPDMDVVFHLFRLAPGSAPSGLSVMSCPDRQAGRSRFFSVQRRIALTRWDLPVEAHVPYQLLAGFCEPGVRLSGKAADPELPAAVRERLIRLAGPHTTAYSEYELASAVGRPDLARPGPGSVNARGRYLLYLQTGGRIDATPTDGMDLASHQDLLLAANQCDAGYARFLLDRGVLGAGQALVYLARELDDAYERDASLQREPAFPLGLAAGDRRQCLALAQLLADHAPEDIRTSALVERVLGAPQPGAPLFPSPI